MRCSVCGKEKPDGPRWIDVAGGEKVCSVECENLRFKRLAHYIAERVNEIKGLK